MNPPNSGQDDFPSPYEPLPPVSPAFGGGGSLGGYPTDPTPPRGEISLDAISDAWKVLQPNLGIWIGVSLAYLLMTLVLQGIQYLINPQSINGSSPQMRPEVGGLYFLVVILSSVAGLFLQGGVTRLAIENVRTGSVDMALLFSAGNVLLNLVVAWILSSILVFFGFLCCLIPGIIASVGLIMTTPLIVDQKVGGLEAMSKSWEAVKSQWLNAFLLVVVLFLLNVAGFLACGIGLLITGPLTALTIATVYLNLFGMGSSTPTEMASYPHSPIADPNT